MEHLNYNHDDPRIVVVFPQVADAIAQYRESRNLPEIKVDELKYGMDEVMVIVNLLGAQLCTGKQATIHGLIDILAEPTDILWILTHGIEEGWFLNDGIVTASETTSLLRSAGVFLTVMNSCSSYEVAQTCADELETAFICTVTEVPDRQAFISGVLFARHLASGLDYVSAWERSKPGQKHPYVLIEAKGLRSMNPNPRKAGMPPENFDMSTIRRFIESVSELEKIIYGDSRFGLLPMREITNQLQKDLNTIKDKDLVNIVAKIDDVIQQQKVRNFWLIAQSVVIVILIIIVSIFVLQPGG